MSHCDENLARIGEALKRYLKENEDRYPATLQELVDRDYISAWDLVCPVSPFAVGECPYYYRGEGLYTGIPREMVIAYDKQPVHKGRRNILFADGKLQRPPEGVFESHIRKDNKLRAESGLPVLTVKAEIEE